MEFIRYISLIGMLLWSLVHILISPYFLDKEMFIHAIVIIVWGEILLILAHHASEGTWFRKKIVSINTVYALIYLLLAFLYYSENNQGYTSFVLFLIGIAKLVISLIYRDEWTTIVLFVLCGISGAIQSALLLSQNSFIPYTNLFPFLKLSLIPVAVDIVLFGLSVWLAIVIINERLMPSIILMLLFLVFGIALIGAGTWSAYVGLSWLISGLILGKGVVSISVPAFKR